MDGLRRIRDKPHIGCRKICDVRGNYSDKFGSDYHADRAELTAAETREKEAIMADLKRERDDAFLRWPVEE